MWPYVPCQVCEPVAVEVGEEHLGLAYVRVTVEHSSYKLLSPDFRHKVKDKWRASRHKSEYSRSLEEELSCTRRSRRPESQMRNGRNRNRKWCLLFFSHTTYFFFTTAAAAQAHGRAHTHTLAHTLFCTTRDTVARTHTATDGHTRVHPRATTYAANHTSTLWLNWRVQRHAVGITHVESSEEVIAHCH